MTPLDQVPWWIPTLCDEAYFARLRADYPEKAHLTNDVLHAYYNDGRKYSIVWDHVGDAYAEYELLADAFLEIVGALESLLHKSDTPEAHDRAYDSAVALLSRFGRGK